MNKKQLLTLMVTLMCLLTACANNPVGGSTLTLGTMPTYSAAIYAVGIEQGFFEDVGVTVDLTVFRSAKERDTAAVTGQLDGVMTDIMGIINLHSKGFPYLMTSAEHEVFSVVKGPVSSERIDQASVGISENTVIEYVADRLVGDQVNQLDKVNIPAVPDRLGALIGGQLDYAVLPEPFTSILEISGGEMLVSTEGTDFQPVVIGFNKRYLKDHKKEVEAFYKGYQETVTYMKTHDYEDYKDALITHGLAMADTVYMYELPISDYELRPVNKSTYEDIFSWMTRKNLLKKPLAFEDLYCDDYVGIK